MARRNRAYYEGLLNNPNIQAYLLTIRKGEGTLGPKGYSTHFGGGAIETLSKNPLIGRTWTAGKYTSSAVGAFQFLNTMKHPTWPNIAARFGFKDFSPRNQDIGALSLIDEKGALPDIIDGNIVAAIEKTKGVWASLPGSKYGQPTQKLTDALAFYQKHGGALGKSSVEKKQDSSLQWGLPDLVDKLSGNKGALALSKSAVAIMDGNLRQGKRLRIAGVAGDDARRRSLGLNMINVPEHSTGLSGKVLQKAEGANKTNTSGKFPDVIPGTSFLTSQLAKKMNGHLGTQLLRVDKSQRSHLVESENRMELNLPRFANTWAVPSLFDKGSFLHPLKLPAPPVPNKKDTVDSLQRSATINQAPKMMDIFKKGETPLEVPNFMKEPFKGLSEINGNSPDLLQSADKKKTLPESSMNDRKEVSGQVTKSVNIHLNKPLIDNLSIVVTTATDGIDDLKGKVEEALLEVLNSANAI